MKIILRFIMLALLALPACSPATGGAPILVPATPTETSTPLPYQACGWNWAQENLPEITTAFQDALTAKGLQFDSQQTYAYAFGEYCVRPDGSIDHFAAMETDFSVNAVPAGLNDAAAQAEYASAVLSLILAEFQPGTVVPGPNLGSVEFAFNDKSGEPHHRTALATAQQVLASGLSGEALFRALFPSP